MPPAVEGYWGKPTATIDWCEENYAYSHYIAEMTNTVSNLMMIIPPLWGMLEVIRQGFHQRFLYCHLSILIVGLGSWAFHMTLLYEMQLFDELPMVWGTCFLIYFLSEVRKPIVKGKMFSNLPLFIFLASFAVAFTAVYLLWPQPIIQHVSYGVLVFVSVVLDLWILQIKGCKVCRKMFIMSIIIFNVGFLLWILDKTFCSNLRSLRSRMPGAIDPFTQLHGWWHLLTGYASYVQILFVIHASYDFKNEKPQQNRELRPCQFGFGLRWFKKSHEF